jgi:hypothetical protein
MNPMSSATNAVLCSMAMALLLGACSSSAPTPSPEPVAEPAAAAPTPEPAPPEPPALEEPLAVHMRDRIGIATQARDAIIRGQLVDATGALTWLAQHRDPKALASAQPFLERVHRHAQDALDAPNLRAAAEAVGAVAASCGDCHRAHARGPSVEPSGFEELGTELTVETHMHAYLWATDTLWNALIADATLWDAGVSALASSKAPSTPRKLAGGFAEIRAWSKDASSAKSSAERASAYGKLIAICGTCHIESAVVPGRAQ